MLLGGCSEEPKPTEPTKPPEPVSGLTAFYKMFASARTWATDALPLRVAEIDVDELKAEGGKAAAWEAMFVSQSQRSKRRFMFSVLHRPARNLRGGVNADPPESWSSTSGEEPFPVQGFKKDSTEAYEVAMKKGRDYAKSHPAVPMKFLLERTRRFPDPAWRVYWGQSVSTSAYSIFVDAVTGEYLATGR